MEAIFLAALLLACGLQFVLSIGATVLLRKRLPRGAYFIGFLVPVITPIALYLLYTVVTRNRPCTPEAEISCGEADAYAFLLSGGILLFNVGISAVIQFILWLIERRRIQAQERAALYGSPEPPST